MMCKDISIQGRVTSGVRLMNLSEGEFVASIAKVRESSGQIEEELPETKKKKRYKDYGDKTDTRSKYCKDN